MRDFYSEAAQEAKQSEAYRQWVRLRVAALRSKVGIGDVLARYGYPLKYGGHKPEQLSCPFHGKDNKPSTRFYPSEGDKPAGVWCFVCQEKWDSITLFKKFEQLEESFTRTLTQMERTFGLETPDIPREAVFVAAESPLVREVEQLFGVCERRLQGAKSRFTMSGYLQVGSVLDRLKYQSTHGKRPPEDVLKVLQQVLSKIGEKERADQWHAS